MTIINMAPTRNQKPPNRRHQNQTSPSSEALGHQFFLGGAPAVPAPAIVAGSVLVLWGSDVFRVWGLGECHIWVLVGHNFAFLLS